MTRFTLLIPSCLMTGFLCSQQTWKVSCNGGPGVHFTDLPPAVAAASPGDEILVYYGPNTCPGGTYFNAPVIDKPLRISGFFVNPPYAGLTEVKGPPKNNVVERRGERTERRGRSRSRGLAIRLQGEAQQGI
jgi:hypothetical protein